MGEEQSEYQRIDLWSTSEFMADMWAVHATNFREHGSLREIRIRNAIDVGGGALMVSLLLDPQGQFISDDKEAVSGFHLLPTFQLDENFVLTSLIGILTPWMTPALAGLRGYPFDDVDNGRTWYITYEQPWETLPLPGKKDREELQVDRFCSDSLLRGGESPYDSYVRGADPPDFVCRSDGDQIQLECTQFAIAERREAQAFLGKLRQRIGLAVRADRRAFAHLAGLCLFLRFGDSNGRSAFPPRPSNFRAIEEVIEALKSYDVDLSVFAVGSEPPDPAPPIPISKLSFGATLHAAPLQGGLPETLFFNRTGFELGFGYLTRHTFDSTWNQLQEIVAAKDVLGAQDLLISVGAANAEGLVFPSDGMVADIAIRSANNLNPPNHLERVFVHFWATKRIVQIWPRRTELPIGNIEVTFVPAHARMQPIEQYGPYLEADRMDETSARHG